MSDSVFPELHTERFLLRRIRADDRPSIYRGLSNARVIAHYGVSYESLDDTQRQMDWFEKLLAEGSGIWWGICRPQQPRLLLGACGLNDLVAQHRRAELGYWLLPEYWGQGIARECVWAVLRHAFDTLGLHRVAADVDPDNAASHKLLQALGFSCEGVRRGWELKNGVFLDLKQYSLLATDQTAATSGRSPHPAPTEE